MEFEVDQEVLLPSSEEGIVVEVNPTIAFYKYRVQITKTENISTKIGDVVSFKAKQMKLKNK